MFIPFIIISTRFKMLILQQIISTVPDVVLVNLLPIQIKEEFRRITTISLEQCFMYKLDHYAPKRIALMKAKGGVVGTKLRPFLDKLSQVCLFKIVLVSYFFAGIWTNCLSYTHTHVHTSPCVCTHNTNPLHPSRQGSCSLQSNHCSLYALVFSLHNLLCMNNGLVLTHTY